MRWSLVLTLLALVARPAVAEDKEEAEKLFQKMESKVRAAKTLRCQFDSTLTVGDEKISLKGTLTLGEGDKLRLEFETKAGGKAAKLLLVSDGSKLASKDSGDPKKDETKEVPKALGTHARVMLPRYGIGILWNSLNRPQYKSASADLDQVSDFKLGVKEEIGKRKTQQIEYTVTRKIDVVSPPKARVKVWIDLETSLPVKLVATHEKDADISAGTETYDEFNVDVKVDENSFEAQENEAEKLFRETEKKVNSAKSVRVASDDKADARGVRLKWTLVFAEGNKCRLEGTVESEGKALNESTISDGAKLLSTQRGTPRPKEDAPTDLTSMLQGSISRCGMSVQWLTGLDGKKQGFKLDEDFKVTDFTLGEKEKVGEHEAQVVRYNLFLHGKVKLSVSVWLDAKTKLPLKRVTTIPDKGGQKLTVTETFTELTLNPKLEPKAFELPRD